MSNHLTEQVTASHVRGRVRRYRIWEPGAAAGLMWMPRSDLKRESAIWGPGRIDLLGQTLNQLQYGWGAIAAECIGRGNRDYRVNTMYIEYENVLDPETEIAVPTYGREEGQEYYQDLALSATRDFLRVPLTVEPSISIEPGYEDSFTDGLTGNVLTFFSQSQGTTGVHGKAYSSEAISKVFGVALVATPEFADPTRDLILARAYFTGSAQAVKLPSSQNGIAWDVAWL